MKNISVILFTLYLTLANSLPMVKQQTYEEFLRSTIDGEPIEDSHGNAWQNSGKFEGDIILSEDEIQTLAQGSVDSKNAVVKETKLWPNHTVYYEIETSYFDEQQIQMIEDAVADLARASCLKFFKRTDENEAYINVRGRSGGCSSVVGYKGKQQNLNLTPPNCFTSRGTIVHEFLHALGFYHMQCSNERNEWIKIVWPKIRWGMYRNFYRYPQSMITNLDVEYDYGSVMHYNEYAFSVDGSKTMIPLKPTNGQIIGQNIAMSPKDIIRLNKLYECPGY